MKSCPFCGKEVDLEDPDTLYTNGIGWVQNGNRRSYHNFREVPEGQWCWSIHCHEHAGGCGAQINGDSRQECIDKWNRRCYSE